MHRQSDYTDDLADRICEGIAQGRSLARICQEEGMPEPRTVYNWLRTKESFLHNYTRAKEDQADFMAEETLEISDDREIDPQHKRIMVDTRKWLASKFKPKKYGDKIQVGGDTDNPLTLLVKEISGNTLRPKDDDQ